MNKILNRKNILIALTVILLIIAVFYTYAQPNKETILANQTPVPAKKTPTPAVLFHYIEITNGCGPYYDKTDCVNMRSGPSTQYKVVGRLRTGIVLQVEDKLVKQDGKDWYKIIQDKEIPFPERIKDDWYVAVDAESVAPFSNIGDENLTKNSATTSKSIVIDLSQEILYAYDGDTLFMQEPISTGLDFTPTPKGTFQVFKKTPSRYMQGPIPNVSTQVYDLPGVPWDLYFTNGGSVIHGAYWHDHFGKPWSHGCVNLAPQKAKELYLWADIGIKVIVKN